MMNIRTQQEIINLDTELNLFEDISWDFLNVSDDIVNSDYFNDINDDDFRKLKQSHVFWDSILPITALGSFLLLCIVLCIQMVGVNFKNFFSDNKSYEEALNMQNAETTVDINYIDGTEVDNSSKIVIMQDINEYFGVINQGDSLSLLDNYCGGQSDFYKTYNSYTQQITESYDIYDCSARALSKLGGLSKVTELDRIVYDEDSRLYYCYVKCAIPTTDDIYQYIYLHQYEVAKHFTSTDINEAELNKYFYTMLDTYPLDISNQTYCIILDSSFNITNDNIITDVCETAYKNAIKQMSNVISSNQKN